MRTITMIINHVYRRSLVRSFDEYLEVQKPRQASLNVLYLAFKSFRIAHFNFDIYQKCVLGFDFCLPIFIFRCFFRFKLNKFNFIHSTLIMHMFKRRRRKKTSRWTGHMALPMYALLLLLEHFCLSTINVESSFFSVFVSICMECKRFVIIFNGLKPFQIPSGNQFYFSWFLFNKCQQSKHQRKSNSALQF